MEEERSKTDETKTVVYREYSACAQAPKAFARPFVETYPHCVYCVRKVNATKLSLLVADSSCRKVKSKVEPEWGRQHQAASPRPSIPFSQVIACLTARRTRGTTPKSTAWIQQVLDGHFRNLRNRQLPVRAVRSAHDLTDPWTPIVCGLIEATVG